MTATEPKRSEDESRARRLLATGAVVSIFGISVGSMVAHTLGGVILVVGWAFFLYGLHAFGRAGA